MKFKLNQIQFFPEQSQDTIMKNLDLEREKNNKKPRIVGYHAFYVESNMSRSEEFSENLTSQRFNLPASKYS